LGLFEQHAALPWAALRQVWTAVDGGDRADLRPLRAQLETAPVLGTTSTDHAIRALLDAAMLHAPADAANAMSWAYQAIATHEAYMQPAEPWAARELVWHDKLVVLAEYRCGIDGAGVTDPVETALLRDVNAIPDDRVTRRVYSDWLEQQSQMSKSEYLRIQCDVPVELGIGFALSRLTPDLDPTWCAIVAQPRLAAVAAEPRGFVDLAGAPSL
ncbi:MAG: TIGR02996 domain-containing protein, partial [Kofleriaceae bacterium]